MTVRFTKMNMATFRRVDNIQKLRPLTFIRMCLSLDRDVTAWHLLSFVPFILGPPGGSSDRSLTALEDNVGF